MYFRAHLFSCETVTAGERERMVCVYVHVCTCVCVCVHVDVGDGMMEGEYLPSDRCVCSRVVFLAQQVPFQDGLWAHLPVVSHIPAI